MIDILKHECGVAMVRLLKDHHHYEGRYGDTYYGLHLLERLLIREYNRGQDGAGIGCISREGEETKVYAIKAEGPSAVEKMTEKIEKEIMNEKEWGSSRLPYYGDLMLGHVRYSTTGRSGIEYLHPFRFDHDGDENESILLCGNFHLINTLQLASRLSQEGIEISPDSDTKVVLNHLALSHWSKDEERKSIEDALRDSAPSWDGGFVICGIDTFGEWWAVRDSHGIRPAFWYADEEKVILASEKSAIHLCAGVEVSQIHELKPGVMIKVDIEGKVRFKRVIEEKPIRECVFERIYFSRADNSEITLEREKLGYYLSEKLMKEDPFDINRTFLSFVPASARSSFLGMVAYFAGRTLPVTAQSLAGDSDNQYLPHSLSGSDGKIVHFGRTIEKGKALRTFISTETGRENLVEKAYIKVLPEMPEGINRLVIIDDSIVRGTTLRSSVLTLLDTYGVDEIVVLSSAPQVRYPDFYGIDMSRLGELVAFRSAVNLLKRKGEGRLLDEIYEQCLLSLKGTQRTKNFVRLIYARLTEEEISEEIARIVTPSTCRAKVKVRFLSSEDLRRAVPNHTGDWCFSGNYPTSGAYTKICSAYVNWYVGNNER